MTGVFVATEDALSEAMAKRLIERENSGIHVAVHVGRKGNGYLKKNLQSFIQIAHTTPVILLTDLDHTECPAILIDNWRRGKTLPRMMLFRVVVHEIEAWLLADRQGFAAHSGIPINRIPIQPELLNNPKETLINLIRRYGRKDIKADILPERGSSARIGLAYNQSLCRFVQKVWSFDRAVLVADSLARAQRRLHELRLALAQ